MKAEAISALNALRQLDIEARPMINISSAMPLRKIFTGSGWRIGQAQLRFSAGWDKSASNTFINSDLNHWRLLMPWERGFTKELVTAGGD